jgi:hypothetical protein
MLQDSRLRMSSSLGVDVVRTVFTAGYLEDGVFTGHGYLHHTCLFFLLRRPKPEREVINAFSLLIGRILALQLSAHHDTP